jgi:hypothetical protein
MAERKGLSPLWKEVPEIKASWRLSYWAFVPQICTTCQVSADAFRYAGMAVVIRKDVACRAYWFQFSNHACRSTTSVNRLQTCSS